MRDSLGLESGIKEEKNVLRIRTYHTNPWSLGIWIHGDGGGCHPTRTFTDPSPRIMDEIIPVTSVHERSSPSSTQIRRDLAPHRRILLDSSGLKAYMPVPVRFAGDFCTSQGLEQEERDGREKRERVRRNGELTSKR